jgi:hypothetical protein
MRSLFSLGAAQAVRGLCRARRNEGEGCRSMDDNRMGRPFLSHDYSFFRERRLLGSLRRGLQCIPKTRRSDAS